MNCPKCRQPLSVLRQADITSPVPVLGEGAPITTETATGKKTVDGATTVHRIR